MHIAEWIQLIFVTVLAVTSWFFSLGRSRQIRVTALALIAVAAIALSQWLWRRLAPTASSSIVQDWLPVLLMLIPYWQIGEFFRGADATTQERLAAFDRRLFRWLGIQPSGISFGAGITTYFQLAYILVYPMIPLGLGALYFVGMRGAVDFYWVVVLLSINISFVITLFVSALPPRLLPDAERFILPRTILGVFNRVILNRAGIQAITFPSAHVASAMAAALVLLRVETWIGAIFLWIALSIAMATVVCGYHYAADVLLAMAIAILVFGLTSRFFAGFAAVQ